MLVKFSIIFRKILSMVFFEKNHLSGVKALKTLAALLIILVSFSSFGLTEDYILYSHAEITKQKMEAKKQQSKKEAICEEYSLSANIKESCLNSKQSNAVLEACLSNTESQTSQSYCLITKNLSASIIDSCMSSTTSEKSEVACLILAEKKVVKTEIQITGCAGLGAMEEIACLKFQK